MDVAVAVVVTLALISQCFFFFVLIYFNRHRVKEQLARHQAIQASLTRWSRQEGVEWLWTNKYVFTGLFLTQKSRFASIFIKRCFCKLEDFLSSFRIPHLLFGIHSKISPKINIFITLNSQQSLAPVAWYGVNWIERSGLEPWGL